MAANSETALTGRNGNFSVASTRVARSTQWVVSPKMATSSEWGDSDSEGFTNRTPGRKDATFTSEGKYDTGAEQFDLFQPGDILKAILWMSTTLYWAFPRALNSDFQMTVNIDTQEVIGWTCSWGADGKYYRPGQANAPVEVLPT